MYAAPVHCSIYCIFALIATALQASTSLQPAGALSFPIRLPARPRSPWHSSVRSLVLIIQRAVHTQTFDLASIPVAAPVTRGFGSSSLDLHRAPASHAILSLPSAAMSAHGVECCRQ